MHYISDYKNRTLIEKLPSLTKKLSAKKIKLAESLGASIEEEREALKIKYPENIIGKTIYQNAFRGMVEINFFDQESWDLILSRPDSFANILVKTYPDQEITTVLRYELAKFAFELSPPNFSPLFWMYKHFETIVKANNKQDYFLDYISYKKESSSKKHLERCSKGGRTASEKYHVPLQIAAKDKWDKWQINDVLYDNQSSFISIVSSEIGVTERTMFNWLAVWKKELQ